MNEIRRRRLWFVAILVFAASGATALALTAMRENINHYYGPTEVLGGQVPPGRTFRLGGLVLEDSTSRHPDSLVVSFKVTDRFKDLSVRFEGILPDLFKEGQSVIATGAMAGTEFVASEVLAKHDETYMPAEVSEALERAKVARQSAEQAGGDQAGANQTGAYQTGAYQTGAYQTGAYQTGAYQTGAYKTGADKTGDDKSGSYKTGGEKAGADAARTYEAEAEKAGAAP